MARPRASLAARDKAARSSVIGRWAAKGREGGERHGRSQGHGAIYTQVRSSSRVPAGVYLRFFFAELFFRLSAAIFAVGGLGLGDGLLVRCNATASTSSTVSARVNFSFRF